MNDVLWMIKFNTHNLRSPQYYFIVFVFIAYGRKYLVNFLGIYFASALGTNVFICLFLCVRKMETYPNITHAFVLLYGYNNSDPVATMTDMHVHNSGQSLSGNVSPTSF